MTGTYHHGNLRETILDAAAEALTETGPEALSLRGLARRAGVSHAAPAHHFGDQAGMLTALAARAQRSLLESLRSAVAQPDPDTVVAAWAVAHGFATLWNLGRLRDLPPDSGGRDLAHPSDGARAAAEFRASSSTPPAPDRSSSPRLPRTAGTRHGSYARIGYWDRALTGPRR